MLTKMSSRKEKKQTQARIDRLRKLQKEAWQDMKHCYLTNDFSGYECGLALYTDASNRILRIKGK